jgi:hypothetical protein
MRVQIEQTRQDVLIVVQPVYGPGRKVRVALIRIDDNELARPHQRHAIAPHFIAGTVEDPATREYEVALLDRRRLRVDSTAERQKHDQRSDYAAAMSPATLRSGA